MARSLSLRSATAIASSSAKTVVAAAVNVHAVTIELVTTLTEITIELTGGDDVWGNGVPVLGVAKVPPVRSWLRRRGRLQHGFLEHCDKRGLRTSANLCLHRGVVLIKQERSVGTLQAPTQRSSAMMLSRSQRPRAPERARCRARYRPAAPQPQSSPRRCRRHTQLCRWCALRHEGHVATLEVCIRRLRGHWSSPSPRVHSPVSRGSLQWFWAVLQGIVRMYGFEGEAGREGEGFTRIPGSSYGRQH